MMKSKNWKDYSRIILDLLNYKIKLKIEDLIFDNPKDTSFLQENLLSESSTKEEVNDTIRLSKGLLNNLIFIKKNFQNIIKKLENTKSMLDMFDWRNDNYILNLEEPLIDDNPDEIIVAISDIILLTKNKLKILDYNDIFEKLINIYSTKDLNDLCKLHKIIDLLKRERIDQKKLNNFIT